MSPPAQRDHPYAVDAGVSEEERCRAIVRHAPDGILLTIPDGRIMAANPAACALLARTEAEICAAGRAELVVADEASARLVEERRRTGRARGILTMRRKDGSTFLADVASTVFESASGELWTSMSFHDVTHNERARRALEILAEAGRMLSSSLELSATLDHLTDLVVPRLADACTVDLVDADGVTRVAVAHRDPARVQALAQVRRRVTRQDTTAGVDYVLRTGKPSHVAEMSDSLLRMATHDAAHLEQAIALGVRSFVSVPLVARGATIGALTLLSDGGVPAFGEDDLALAEALGQRAAMAIDNARRHAEVLSARRLRDEVLAVVAHDLRGPLYVIQLHAILLEKQHPSEEVIAIRRAVRRADALIHDLLLASKAESGTLPLDRRPTDIGSIVDEVSALHELAARVASVHFVCGVDGEVPRISVDRNRIIQLLSNLVANAIKFTPKDGTVELRARADGTKVLITVRDTGVGIAPEALPHVFDRFWQGANRRELGAGLGLSICRGIANAHGGEITVASTLGQGTTFTVVLPRDDAPLVSSAVP